MRLEEIGKTVRERRKAQGLTQRQVAIKADITERTYINLENSNAATRIDVLQKVLDAMGLEIELKEKEK